MLARLIPVLFGAGVVAAVAHEVWPRPAAPLPDAAPLAVAAAVDGASLPPTPAEDLLVLRRLHLALVGTVPSLEEIRRFEATTEPDRLDRWTAQLLNDPRHHRWFARRLASVYVGEADGAFLVYRRDRFVDFLETALAERVPYDELVRQMITGRGLWTSRPQTNFVTAAVIRGEIDEEELTSRTVRAFLGQRIDCAACHDHPFEDWTQDQFRGLAAFYSETKHGALGVHDTKSSTAVAAVPFGEAYLPETGARRERLAAWITHPNNRRFPRATVNRVWTLMFGRPLVAPVDELGDPGDDEDPTLDLLAADYVEHGYDLRRLVRAIAQTSRFASSDFPVSPIDTEQLVGSLLQSASVRTLRVDDGLLVRLVRFMRTQDFEKNYGTPGENGTLAQALVRMNGKLVTDLTDGGPFNLAGRVAAFGGSDDQKLEALYLAYLTRRPTETERERLLPFEDDDAVSDVAWALVNSPEMSWHH